MEKQVGDFHLLSSEGMSPVGDANDPLGPINLELPGEWAPGLLPVHVKERQIRGLALRLNN